MACFLPDIGLIRHHFRYPISYFAQTNGGAPAPCLNDDGLVACRNTPSLERTIMQKAGKGESWFALGMLCRYIHHLRCLNQHASSTSCQEVPKKHASAVIAASADCLPRICSG